MFPVCISHGSLIIILFTLRLVSGADAGEAEIISMMCFHIKLGTIWCTHSSGETTEHWVSFLDDRIDDQTASQILVNFLRDKKAENPNRRFLLTCRKKCTIDEPNKLCTCRNHFQRFSHEQFFSWPEQAENFDIHLMKDFSKNHDLIFVDSEDIAKMSAYQLKVRDYSIPFDCRILHGKTQAEINWIILNIIRQRLRQGYYRSGSSTPQRSPARMIPNAKVRQIANEIRGGNVEFFKQTRTIIQASPGHHTPKVITNTWGSPSGRRQVEVWSNASVVQHKKSGVVQHHSNSPRRTTLQKQKGGGVVWDLDSPESPPTDDRPLTAKEHLQPENNNVIKWNEDKLLGEQTPVNKSAFPVDANKLRKRLQEIKRQKSNSHS